GNLMERVALLSLDAEVTPEMLGLPVTAPGKEPEPAREETARSLEDAVRDRVAEVLRQTSWNISRSASLLGISRNTLRARIERYSLTSRAPAAFAPRRAARPALARTTPAAAPAPAPAAALRWERRRVTLLWAKITPSAKPDAQHGGSRGLGRHAAPFAGRHREIELLWSRLDSAIRGQGQIVGISGEAGIGKSRVVYEFHQSVVGKPIGYVEAQCLFYGLATPYVPL